MRESRGKAERGLSRRQMLELSTAAALLLGGVVAGVVRTRGYSLPPGRRLASLSPWQFVVLQHAARRIAAPDPEARRDASIPSADDVDAAGFVDGWLVKMPPRVRRDFGRLLAYIEHLAPLRAGFPSRFTRLGPADQDVVLAATEASSSDLLRAGFDGLKSLVLMGYYRDARAWGILGYDGPRVGRPPSGWRDAR
jgi:hypothetical protein